jgi:MOSC domain-containing protein YiiM
MCGRVESINVSRGGVPKASVFEGHVTQQGISGDVQRDLRFHGGPDRAVSLFSLEAIEALKREGHPISPGSTGENLTLSGLDWSSLKPGTELRIGSVHLLITGYASPCEKISESFQDGDISRLSHKRHAGSSRLYTRVLAGGVVRPGDEVHVLNS